MVFSTFRMRAFLRVRASALRVCRRMPNGASSWKRSAEAASVCHLPERPGSFIFKLQAAFLWLFKLRLLRTLVFVLQWQSEEAAAGALKVQVAVRS